MSASDVISVSCFLATVGRLLAVAVRDNMKSYCQGETFQARCSYDEVIEMQRAVYGRMELGRCVELDMGYIGCNTSVLDLADDRCSGRRMCDITVPDLTFESTKPCLELKSYLQASYTCIKVLTVGKNSCRSSKPLNARLPAGRIASVTAHESRCTSRYDATWIIHGEPGQRIKISLLDFNAAAHLGRRIPPTASKPEVTMDRPCHRYATIIEPVNGVDVADHPEHSSAVCGRRARRQHVYTSTGHVVHIRLESYRVNPDYFVLSYEVFGCADPPTSGSVWFNRDDVDSSEAKMGCRTTKETWRVSCVDNQWRGTPVNCSHYESFELAVRSADSDSAQSSNGALLVAVLIICAFLIAIVVIIVGIILRCQRHRHHQSHESGNVDKTAARASRSHHRGVVESSRHLRGGPSRGSNVDGFDDDDGGGLVDLYDDELGDVASYVYPSNKRSGGGSDARRYGRQHSAASGSTGAAGYDTVDAAGVQRPAARSDAYEKVSSCRYVHIWQMPLPKAPDE